MNDFVLLMIEKYERKGIFVDTNLLLLYIVGAVERRLIKDFKRTQQFTTEDFELVSRFIDKFEVMSTTPHILTEVSNFLGKMKGDNKIKCLAALAETINLMNEDFKPGKSLAKTKPFLKFGLADSAIADSAYGKYLVFTEDLPLYQYLSSTGVDVINFNHLRNFK